MPVLVKILALPILFGEARDLPSIYLGERSLKIFLWGQRLMVFRISDGTLYK